MQTSKSIREQQRIYAERLLVALGEQLAVRGVTHVLVITQNGRPALDVTDSRCRMRRVFVHLPFCWFYWGDQHDERVSFLQMAPAVDRIEQAAREGWREGEQGDLSVDLNKMLDAYRG
ncbi:hypothetical protein FE391_41700 [Nonomuraea sp. KC401]|uniref:hypothetical protein n=1 Tax=unclassified Nonomuraea TaxID=2593643 RepID=UPI0010FE7D02|nr:MULTISPECIES: hypothetical protein [unclassified Nonomuraea]NBE99990.1 hypothetical protein [Nonomuraea sp. K271]TLF54487.1 hypothetical protein FE391_41700 [Nonomuraea sp. KC401]